MNAKKKTAIMYGAGNIGRGFIGQVLHDSGYEVVFIDVDQRLVSTLNEHNSYTQLIVDGDNKTCREISGIRAVDGNNKNAVVKEIAACDIMAVSVGAAVLPYIAPIIAEGIALREQPLNILVCENLAHAPDIFRKHISEYISDTKILDRIGFVGTTIGRMVPVMSQQQREENPSLITVEPFCTLPIDADAVVKPSPDLQHTIFCSPFAFEESKKLYIHNMGHALAAYFGFMQGYTFIWQAMDDKSISEKVFNAMSATAEALARKYNEDRCKLNAYVNGLLIRFGNKALGDTVARVGGDPLRKLAPGDRLIGAIELCVELRIGYSPLLYAVAAALRFDVPEDPSASQLQKILRTKGIVDFLCHNCGLSAADAENVQLMYLSF